MGIKKGDRGRLRGKKEREGGDCGENDRGYLKRYGSVLKDIWLSNTNLPGKTQ